jgi:HSP20 family protein
MTGEVEVKRADRPFAHFFDWFEPFSPSRLVGFRSLEDRMRVEEEVVDNNLVIRAELPGVDPDKDVDVTLGDGVLSVRAERRKEEKSKTDVGLRTEFQYGSLRRTMVVPRQTRPEDVTAAYCDGILEIKLPLAAETIPAQKIAITRG